MNECNLGTDNCGGTCTNTIGSFECGCIEGFQLNSNGRTCSDINECASSNNGGCSQTCSNTVGSFVCGCESGFTLQADGFTCERKSLHPSVFSVHSSISKQVECHTKIT